MAGEPTRVLFVDDEESIRTMLSAVLKQHGLKVRTAASVSEALVEINATRFDVLICDLNLEKAGDGFLVLAAMRHLHPDCVNLILTGYPAFETALEAMHNQVDDYLVKPADISLLLNTIERRLSSRKKQQPGPPTRVVSLLSDPSVNIAEIALELLERHPDLAGLSVPREERLQHLNSFVAILVQQLESREDKLSEEQLRRATEYANARKAEQYNASMVAREFQQLEQAIGAVVRNHLPTMGIAALFYDYERCHKVLGALMLKALEVFDSGTTRPQRKSNKGTVASD